MQAVLREIGKTLELDLSDVQILASSKEERPRPIYLSTATQIGLLPNPNVPDLISYLLVSQSSAHSQRFLRRWLLTPPPYRLAQEMQRLCYSLSVARAGIPICRPIPVGKLVSMMGMRQCNVPLFRDVNDCAGAMIELLRHKDHSPLVGPLLELTRYESGLECNKDILLERGQAVLKEIQSVIPSPDVEDPVSIDPAGIVPESFFQRNEEVFRGCVARGLPGVEKAYEEVQRTVGALCRVVKEDFPKECEVVLDPINNAIMLKKKPEVNGKKGDVYIAPTDRNRKTIPKRWTTKRVEAALGDYLAAVDAATLAVKTTLQDLSDCLKKDLPTMISSLHIAVIIQAAAAHVAAARQRRWCLPEELSDDDHSDPFMRVEGLVPYWMDRASCVGNTFDFGGIWLLTAPNMSGKSTLMRALAVAALLGNCGLYVPCTKALIPRYDNVFVRTASYDVPSEGKSAFALEMDDVRVMLRDCTKKSLVMLDEIGKGTSARDGAALSGALLETLDRIPVSAIFATHLHEMFDLPLHTTRVSYKRMGMKSQGAENATSPTGGKMWTYVLEDGKCTDSMAMTTARAYGIPLEIIERAEELGHIFDQVCRRGSEELVDDSVAPASMDQPGLTSPNGGGGDDSLSVPPGPLHHASARLVEIVEEYRRNSPEGLSAPNAFLYTVGENQDPPPSLEGYSCVYILEVHSGPNGSELLYVGETDSIRTRLTRHRKHFGKAMEARVVPLTSKTEARTIETVCINELKNSGYALLSDFDGSRQILL